MARNQSSAENTAASLFSVDTGEPVLIAIQHSAVHFVERHGQAGEIQAPLSSLLFVKSDVGYFGISIRAPRDNQSARFFPAEEERVLERHPRHGIRDVGELVLRADIAGRVNAPIGGPQLVVDGDASLIKGDAGGVQVKAF